MHKRWWMVQIQYFGGLVTFYTTSLRQIYFWTGNKTKNENIYFHYTIIYLKHSAMIISADYIYTLEFLSCMNLHQATLVIFKWRHRLLFIVNLWFNTLNVMQTFSWFSIMLHSWHFHIFSCCFTCFVSYKFLHGIQLNKQINYIQLKVVCASVDRLCN